MNDNWKRCPSTHCERAQECRSPNECSGTDANEIARRLGITEQSANYLLDEAAARFGAREWADFDDYFRSIRNLYRLMSCTKGT